LNWSPLVISRLSEVAKYISLDNPVAAQRWVNKVFAQVEKLSEFPGRGRMVPEVGDKTIREIISGNYRIIYRLKRSGNFNSYPAPCEAGIVDRDAFKIAPRSM